jgi:hypothetical protein
MRQKTFKKKVKIQSHPEELAPTHTSCCCQL